MNLIEIVPLTRLPKGAPDILSYFTSRDVSLGSFIVASIGKRRVVGIATKVSPLSDVKSVIKKQDFGLKKIDEVLQGYTLPKEYIRLYGWVAAFFLASKNSIFKTALPNYCAKPTAVLKKYIAGTPITPLGGEERTGSTKQIIVAEGGYEDRYRFYIKHIRNVIGRNDKNQILVLFPTRLEAEGFSEYAKKELDILPGLFGSWQSPRENVDIWQKAASGKTKVLIGTRNSVFVPFPYLALCIVDSEASPYYKAWDGEPKFDARDIAEKIADVLPVTLILGSSLLREETHERLLQDQKIIRERLGAEARIPLQVLFLKTGTANEGDAKNLWSPLSGALKEKLVETLSQSGSEPKKVFLFAGRRGHSANILCRDCGYVALCKRCASPLVIHLGKDILSSRFFLCHKCLARETPFHTCPECGSHKIQGFGVGTQKIEEELKSLFPDKKIIRIDSDTLDDPKDLKAAFVEIQSSKYDIVVGTEIALKPSLLPRFAISAIVSLDQLLSQPDFRQEEKIFYIVQQLRDMTDTEVIIQTAIRHHTFLSDLESGRSESFFTRDSVFRKQFSYPPFAELIKLTIKDRLRLEAEKKSLLVKNIIQQEFTKAGIKKESLYLLGPVPAFIPREKNEFIYHIVLKVKDQNGLVKERLSHILPPYVYRDVNPKTVL